MAFFLNFRFCLSHDEENEFTALEYFQKLLLLLFSYRGVGISISILKHDFSEISKISKIEKLKIF